MKSIPVAIAVLLAIAACDSRKPPQAPPPKPTTAAPAPPSGAASSAVPSQPQPPQTASQPTSPPVPGSQREFMESAARNGQLELAASRLAAERAATPAVKSFAEEMLKEHTRVGDELRQLAKAKGIDLPGNLADPERSLLEKVQTARGAAFDREYAQSIGVEAHAHAVGLFERAANEGGDPDIQGFAQKTLPGLRSHLDMAKKLEAEVNKGAKS